jgi:hypothetical protein
MSMLRFRCKFKKELPMKLLDFGLHFSASFALVGWSYDMIYQWFPDVAVPFILGYSLITGRYLNASNRLLKWHKSLHSLDHISYLLFLMCVVTLVKMIGGEKGSWFSLMFVWVIILAQWCIHLLIDKFTHEGEIA